MDSRLYLADKLKEIRNSSSISRETLGEALDRTPSAIGMWESAASQPSPEMLIRICLFYKVDISYFFPPDVTGGGLGTLLTNSELEIVAIYRYMNDEGKEMLLDYARMISRKPKFGLGDSGFQAVEGAA